MRPARSALALVLLAGACAVFHPRTSADRELVASAENAHNHALQIYNSRCRPVRAGWTISYCRDFFSALRENERAISAALSAEEIGGSKLQLADLRTSIHALSKKEEGPPR